MSVVTQSMSLTMAGLAFGFVAAYAVTRVMASMLYGIRAIDPITFIVMPLALAGVAMLASYVPARRAPKVDPMVALRYE